MAWQPTPIFLPGESHGQRNPVGYSPWGCKESDTTKVTWHASCKYILEGVLRAFSPTSDAALADPKEGTGVVFSWWGKE